MTRIERLRIARGWSQGQMAAYLGITQPQVSRIECGTNGEGGAVARLLGWLEASIAVERSAAPAETARPSSGARL